MNCHEALTQINELFDRELNLADSRLLDDHLADCERCRRYLDEMQAVDQWAKELEPVSPGPNFAERVMAHVAPRESAIESSTTAFEIILGAIVALAVVPALLGGNELLYDWLVAATGATGEFFGALAGDLAGMVSDTQAAMSALRTALAQWQGPLNPLGMVLTAATAALLAVIFNFVQARKVERP